MRNRLCLFVLAVAAAGVPTTLGAQSAPVCMKGKPDSPVRVDVYSDYECPSCGAFFLQTMQSVFKDYADTGKACVVYRDFPLKVHEHALEAAHYARAAQHVSPQLWAKVAEALFRAQAKWSKDGNLDGAVAAILDSKEMDTLREALDDNSLYDAIGDDIQEGEAQGVEDAPTVIISGKNGTEEIEGALRYSALKPRLDSALGE